MKVIDNISLFDPNLISSDDGTDFYTPIIRGFSKKTAAPAPTPDPDPLEYLEVNLNENSDNTSLETLYRGVIVEGLVRPNSSNSNKITQAFTQTALLVPSTNELLYTIDIEEPDSLPPLAFDPYNINYSFAATAINDSEVTISSNILTFKLKLRYPSAAGGYAVSGIYYTI